MGTRGLVGFTVDGQHHLTYNHFDSYPDSLGVEVLTWLKQTLVEIDGHSQLPAELLGALKALEEVSANSQPTERQKQKLREHGITHPEDVSTGRDFYAWLRSAQGNIEATIKSGFWIGGGYEFGFDSLFCEWGYVIDVDKRTLDVYRGFNEDGPPKDGIWAGEQPKREFKSSGPWYPIQLAVSFDFDEIAGEHPEQFDDEEFVRSAYAAIRKFSHDAEVDEDVDA